MLRSYRKLFHCLSIAFLVGVTLLVTNPTYATYTISLSTNDSISINASPLGAGVSVYDESVTVTTNCSAGYNLTLATTTDSTLYLNGDSTNAVSTISSLDSSYALSDLAHNANTWGYSLTGNINTTGSFNPLSTSPTSLKTTNETASESDIEDTFSIYYGAAINTNLDPGIYSMGNDGAISYYLTISPSCVDSAVITFNENLDGQGTEGTDNTIADFPTTSDNTTDTTNGTITLANKRPTRTGYTFMEWNTEADGSGDYYYPNETIPMGQDGLSGFVTLYAIWIQNCAANTICYNANHADGGTMVDQSATSNTNNDLISSNFNRTGYGFAGWNTEADGTGTNYGPNQTLNPGNLATTGLTLFAHWIEPTGTLQTWAGASNMSTGDVIALKDNRDDEVYAVAKLADNNVWLIENLRLIPGTANITDKNTNNPADDFLEDAPGSSSATTQCSANSSACDDQIYYYDGNMNRSATQLPTGNTSANAWYSYGVMYNWYTATAGNGTYGKTSGSVAGDICPSGWRLPTGGSGAEYATYTTAIGGTGSTGAANIRKYPNNFIFSGDYNPQSVIPDGRGTQGRLWQATAANNNNAYRMGYNSSSITPVNTYNKWDNFAVRCIYQGGNIPFSEVTVDFAGSGITGVTFENSAYGNETATAQNPTVPLAEESAYTITATSSTGYEFSSWATTSGGALGSTSTNPTTYTITSDATLTVTGAEIPSYTVTVSLGEHITGITFANATYGTTSLTPASNSCIDNNNGTYTCAVSLRRGIEYNLTSSYEAGYTIDEWTTSVNGALSSTTTASTTYAISGVATLSLSAQETDELSYTLVYDAGSGTDAPVSVTETSFDATHDFSITNSAPIYYGYTFTGWTETNGGSTIEYTSGDTITVASTGAETTKVLYAVYTTNSCPSGKICYYDNGADVTGGGRGTMANQSASSNTSVNLIPSNYSKSGYGFAGWATSANATPYGPNANITTPDISSTGLALYAKWVKSTGDLQTWSGCGTLALNSVTALTDTRDNNTYAVTKLADDNCWIMENLRLDPGTATITAQNTHNPTSTFITESNAGNGTSLSDTTLCNASDDTTCINSIQYNSNSTNRSLNQSYNTNTNSAAWYSYGTYYNWYTATAGNGTYSMTANATVAGDICPRKWRIPTGNSTGEFNALNTAVNSGSTSSDAGLRAYPVNFLWSGDYNNVKRNSSYSNGRIWTATSKDDPTAYRVGFASNTVTASTNTYNKWDGFIVRCIYDLSTVDYYDVTVTFPANVTSVSFTNANYGIQTATPSSPTVSLAQGASYALNATFVSGYALDTWTNGSNSTIGSTSANPTTFSIANDSTLTLTTKEICGAIVGANSICYAPNGNNVEGTMGVQTIDSSATSITLLASNFSRPGYGFAGWSTDSTVTNASKIYGPQEDLTFTAGQYNTAGIKLYAVWIQSAGSLQSDAWNVCKTLTTAPTDGTANLASVSALTDARDHQTYAIAKLADGNCWMIENLRLEAEATRGNNQFDSSITNESLAQGYGKSATYGNFEGLADAEESWSNNISEPAEANSLYYSGTQSGTASIDIGTSNAPVYRMPRYKNNYTQSRAINPTDNDDYFYSYGNRYTWPAAKANTGYDLGDLNAANTSICPSGWKLPTGGTTIATEYYSLVKTLMSDNPPDQSYMYFSGGSSSGYYSPQVVNANNDTPRQAISKFPNNILTIEKSRDQSTASQEYWASTLHFSQNTYPHPYILSYFDTYLRPGLYPGTYPISSYAVGSIRCIIEAPTHQVTLSPDSHISSVSFSTPGEITQTATSSNPTVSLMEDKSYTITATADTGYEFVAWSTTPNGTIGSTTTNPTTYIVTDAATLTVTSQTIPTYTVTVNMDSNVTSITFTNNNYGTQSVTATGSTVTLRRGISYNVTASFAEGFIFTAWSTTPNGTIGSTTTNPTTYAVTDVSTLSLISEAMCGTTANPGTICYDRNDTTSGTLAGTMGRQPVDSSATSITLLASNFSNSDYGFAGWSTTKIDPDSPTFRSDLESATVYGPQEDIAFTAGQYSSPNNGLKLYAVWVPVAEDANGNKLTFQTINLQTITLFEGGTLESKPNGYVTALKDQRDGQTYAIAKLADGRYWMIENLRLEAEATRGNNQFDSSITNRSLSQGYYGQFAGLAEAEINYFYYTNSTPNSLYCGSGCSGGRINIGSSNTGLRIPRYNNQNTQSRDYNPTTSTGRIYSYGNYYNWAASIANTTTGNYNAASICPAGWVIPQDEGEPGGVAHTNYDFWKLVVTDINNGTNPANYDDSALGSHPQPYYMGIPEGSTVSNALRTFPNNFLYSGTFNTSSAFNRGIEGTYWSSTQREGVLCSGARCDSLTLAITNITVRPGTGGESKGNGGSIRCIADIPTSAVTLSP